MEKKKDRGKAAAVVLAALLCIGAAFFGLHLYSNRSPQLPSSQIREQISPLPQMWEADGTDDTSADSHEADDEGSSQQDSSKDESLQRESSWEQSFDESKAEESSYTESSRAERSADTSRQENLSSHADTVQQRSESSTLTAPSEGDVTSTVTSAASSGSATDTSSSSTAEGRVTLVTPKPVPDGKKANREYFTTDIRDGETVGEETYFFKVTHLDSTLKLRSCEVSVNSGDSVLYSGRCSLSSGKNIIRITCTYTDADNSVIRAFRDYTVYLRNEKPVITTDLKNCTVHEGTFTFTAEGSQGGRALPVDIDINGEKLVCNGEITVELTEGENVLTLSCGETQRIFTVNYEPLGEPEILTDLTDMTVYGRLLEFTASCVGDSTASLTVQVNGKTIRGENGKYSCTLDFGTNDIRLLMRGRVQTEKHFTVNCLPEYNEAELPVLVKNNISDGMEVMGSALSVRVTAQDYLGNRIYSGKLTLSVNGNAVGRAWEDSSETGYELTLASGENTIIISLTDNDGRQREYRYTVTSKDADTATETGHISITVNCELVGQGIICSDPSFPILSSETGFDTIQRFFNENGYEVYYRGSDSSRYLCGIGMGGAFGSAAPTDTVRTYLEDRGITYSTEHNADALSEFDFTAGSGWIYKRNGKIPGYALTSTVLGDGESIELFFSLDYGNDVRSFYP